MIDKIQNGYDFVTETRVGRALLRLAKVAVAAGLSTASIAAINAVGNVDLPPVLVPVVTAVLVAVDKYVRDIG